MSHLTRPAEPDFTIKRGVVGPTLDATIQAGGVPQDLTGATVTFHMDHENGAPAVDAGAVTIVSAIAGTVRYAWQAADVAVAGWYRAEFHVTGLTPSAIRWPSRGYLWIEIQDEVGAG